MNRPRPNQRDQISFLTASLVELCNIASIIVEEKVTDLDEYKKIAPHLHKADGYLEELVRTT